MPDLLTAIRARKNRAESVYGIRTADQFARPVLECCSDSSLMPDVHLGGMTEQEFLKECAETLVYTNDEMAATEFCTSPASMDEFCKQRKLNVPDRTIMVFENVVTTPKKDRDGDILETQGATVDPQMPLLWHHMLPMPIGKMLDVLKHNTRRLVVASAIIDSQLGEDAAKLVEFGALRISHGFQPKRFEKMPEEEGEMFPGFRISEFEIMEESLVSVPSNTDAVITAYSSGKLHSPSMKAYAKKLHDERPVQVPGFSFTTNGDPPVGTTVTFAGIVDKSAKTDEEPKISPVSADGRNCPYCGDTGSVDATGTCTSCGATMAGAAELAVKAGRVLSKANENRIAQASELLEEVLRQVRAEESDDEEKEPLRIAELAGKVAESLLAHSLDETDRKAAATICSLLSEYASHEKGEVVAPPSRLAVRNGKLALVR